jgi:hypothetical protein
MARQVASWISMAAISLLLGMSLAPAGAHIGKNERHLWKEHILPRVSALPDCGFGEALQGIGGGGQPSCTSTGPSHWAQVRPDGSIIRSSDGVTVQRTSAGTYEMFVPVIDVEACVTLATINNSEGTSATLTAFITTALGDQAGEIQVWVSNPNGQGGDAPFHVAVFCGL